MKPLTKNNFQIEQKSLALLVLDRKVFLHVQWILKDQPNGKGKMTNATTSHIQINKNYHFNYSCDDKKALPSKVFQRSM